MISSKLLTKYILASFWMRIFIFLLFYLVVRQLHFIDADISIVECMPRKRATKIIFETKEEVKQSIPTIAESKDDFIRRLEKQIIDLTNERNGLRKGISKVMKDNNQSTQTKIAEIKRLKREIKEMHSKMILPEAIRISLPTIQYAEPIAEIVPSDVAAISLENENIRLRTEVQELINNRQNLMRQIEESIRLRENYISLTNENTQLRTQIQEIRINSQNLFKQSLEEKTFLRQRVANLEAQTKELQNEVDRLHSLPQAKEASRGMITRILNRFRYNCDLQITEEEYYELKRAFNKYNFEKIYKSRDMK